MYLLLTREGRFFIMSVAVKFFLLNVYVLFVALSVILRIGCWLKKKKKIVTVLKKKVLNFYSEEKIGNPIGLLLFVF